MTEIETLTAEIRALRAEVAALRVQIAVQPYARPCVSPYTDWWRTPVYSTGTWTAPDNKTYMLALTPAKDLSVK